MPARLLHPNRAGESEVKELVQKELVPIVKKIRTDRYTLREQWLRYHRIWSCVRDQQSYKGRSQTYIPIGRKLIENWVKRLRRDLFPQDAWFDVRAVRQVFEQRAPTVKALFTYFFTKHTQLRRHASPFLRQLVMLGTSPVKVVWRLEERELRMLRDVFDDDGTPTGRWETVVEKVLQRVGPTFRVVDLFAWYVFPYTVADVNDASLVFEDLLVPRPRVHALSEKQIHPDDESYGTIYDKDAVKRLEDREHAAVAKDKFNAEARRMADKGFTQMLDFLPHLVPGMTPYDLTECRWHRQLPDDEAPRHYLVTIAADDIVLRVQEEPFFHGSSWWLAGKFTEVENEFYGRGLPEVFDRLQYFATDLADQASDALVWSMNPISVVDVFRVQDPQSIRMRPGAKWLAQVDGVKFAEPPKDSAVVGFSSLGQVMGLAAQAGDVTPAAAVGQSRSRNRSKQEQERLAAESQVDIREVVEQIEDQVLVPFLRLSHSLTQQFLDRKLVLQIAGADGASYLEQQVGVEDIIGDFEFQWLGSLASMNLQVRAQQMVNFMALASKIPPEALAQQNAEIDLKYILREIWGTGFGLRNAERVVRDKVRQTSLDWRIENELFQVNRGAEVVVSEADNDLEHAVGHQPLLERPGLPPAAQRLVFSHLQAHVAAHLAKQQLRQQQQIQAAQQAQQGRPGANGNGAGRIPPPFGPGRLAQTTSFDDLLRGAPRGQG